MVVPFYILPVYRRVSLIPHLRHTWYDQSFSILAILIDVMVPHCGFNSHFFLMANGMFPHVYLEFIIFFWWKVFQDFCTFILGFFVFLLPHLDSSLYVLDLRVFSPHQWIISFFSLWPHHMACSLARVCIQALGSESMESYTRSPGNSQPNGLSFNSFNRVFQREVLSFDEVWFSSFLLWTVLWVSHKILAYPKLMKIFSYSFF